MKKEDLDNLKFTDGYWCTLSSEEQSAYMLGFLKCKVLVRELMEKDNEN